MEDKFPDLSLLANADTQTLDQNVSEVFISMGFTPLVHVHGIGLLEATIYRCAEKFASSRQGRSERYKNNDRIMEDEHEILYHPSGLIASINGSRRAYSTDDFEQKRWSLSCLVKTDVGQGHPARLTSAGQSVIKLLFESDGHENIAQFLSEVKEKYDQGLMLSPQRWAAVLNDPVFTYDKTDCLPLDGYQAAWVDLALPWMDMPINATATTAHFPITECKRQTVARYEKQFYKEIGKILHSVPDDVKDLVQIQLGSQVKLLMHINKIQHKKRVNLLEVEETARKFLDVIAPYLPNDGLSGQGSEILSQWVEEFLKPSKASAIRWNKLPMHIPGLKGFSRLDMALAMAHKPGCSHKIIQAIETSSDEQLIGLCRGDGLAAPLGYSLVRIMLHTENRAYEKTELQALSELGKRCLSHIVNRLGSSVLVWDSQWGNVWGLAAGQYINLPMDDDLAEYQMERNNDFVLFAEETGLDLPEEISFSDVQASGFAKTGPPVYTCSLLNASEFAELWGKHARTPARRQPLLYRELLRPAISLLTARRLSDFSTQGQEKPQYETSRPKM